MPYTMHLGNPTNLLFYYSSLGTYVSCNVTVELRRFYYYKYTLERVMQLIHKVNSLLKKCNYTML
jgi:hypothetical protein